MSEGELVTVLAGEFSDRPAAGGVAAGTVFACEDVPENYLSDGVRWRVIGGAGDEIGHAEHVYPMVNAPTPTLVPVPGLITTFIAGERPVVAKVTMRLAVSVAGSRAFASVRLDGVEVARLESSAVGADVWQTEYVEHRIPGLTPGSTHTIDVWIGRGALQTGIARTSGDETNPNTIQVVTA